MSILRFFQHRMKILKEVILYFLAVSDAPLQNFAQLIIVSKTATETVEKQAS